MKLFPYPLFPRARHSSACLYAPAGLALLTLLVVCPSAFPQASSHPPSAHTPQVPGELQTRLAAAEQARSAGDPAIVVSANRLVIASALRELAGLKLLESQYADAINSYRSSLDFEETPDADESLGYAEFRAGHLDQAIAIAQKAHEADPHNLRIDRLLASALDQKGDYVQAIEPFTRIAEAQPAVDNLYPLAECLLQTKRPEDKQHAAEVFAQMKQIAGDSGSLHVLMGRAYRDGGDMDEAVREFRRALAIDPRTPHAHYFLGLAQLYMRDWKPTPEVEAEFQKEAELYPNDYLANYMLGLTTSGERNYETSDKYLAVAARIDPTSPDPPLYLGMNAFAEGKMDRAELMMKQAVKLTGSDEERTNYQVRRAYVDLARIESQNGHTQEADAFAAKARDLQNKIMQQTQQDVSRALAAKGDAGDVAVVPLTRQQENKGAPGVSNPDDPGDKDALAPQQLAAAKQREQALKSVLGLAFNDLATADAIQKNYPEALGFYQQAEYWDSSLPGLEKNLGLCAFRAKNYTEAIPAFSAALQQNTTSAPLRAMLGLSYFATDKYQDAAHSFDPLGASGMTDGEVGYAWAASLAHIGDMKKATEVLSAYEGQPRAPDALLLVGQLWTEIGDYARGIATLERAVGSDPQLPRAHFYEGLPTFAGCIGQRPPNSSRMN
jgi:tetratricopeptide (TPR) repeat protein